MQHQAWTDRLTRTQHSQMDIVLTDFEKHRDLDILYEGLVNSGMTSEEAEEYTDLMAGDGSVD